jgi:hypothetical protein
LENLKVIKKEEVFEDFKQSKIYEDIDLKDQKSFDKFEMFKIPTTACHLSLPRAK